MQLTYHYRKNKIHTAGLILLGLFGLLLVGVGVAAGLEINNSQSPSDKKLFITLGLAITTLGVVIIWFGIWGYRKTESFYRSNDWYGITITEQEVTSREFDLFKIRTRNFKRTDIVSVKKRPYKGILYLDVTTTKRKYHLPLSLLNEQERTTLEQTVTPKQ
jgi:hypothetical protein